MVLSVVESEVTSVGTLLSDAGSVSGVVSTGAVSFATLKVTLPCPFGDPSESLTT